MGDQDGQRNVIAQRLEHLFATMRGPHGRPYTMREVADGINEAAGENVISVQYLSQLRLGHRTEPSYSKLEAIAKFFGVDVLYFSDDLTAARADEQLETLQAMQDAGVRALALRAAGLSEASLDAVKALIEHMRTQEGLRDGSIPPSGSSELSDMNPA
jgi:transcriptional regulator with XRE-family HTH domain